MPDLSADEYLELYRRICEIRQFELKIESLFGTGEIGGTFHSSAGQEAAAVGVAAAAAEGDIFVSNHRGHGHLLAKGCGVKHLAAELFGRSGGVCAGRGGTQHTAQFDRSFYGANGITGGGIPVATGIALSVKMRGESTVVFAFLGDGATNQGTFHESLNMASIWELPIVYVCEVNGYALSMPTHKSMKVESVTERAASYRMQSASVDGNDLAAVVDSASRAADAARGGAPFLLECATYRMKGHSKSDKCHYRTREEEARWAERDPMRLMARALVEDFGIAQDRIDSVETEAEAEIESALEFARSSGEPETTSALDHVYASPVDASANDPSAEPLSDSCEEVFYREGLRRALIEEMDRDESVFVLGEDIAAYGGVFKVTEGLAERYGESRIIDTPISENSFTGVAVGSAIAGMRPVVEIMFMDFLLLALDQLVNQAAKFSYIYHGQTSVPMVLRTPAGGYRGYGATHSQSFEQLLMGIPGLKVAAPSTARDACGMLKWAIRDPDPVVFVEHKLLYGTRGPVPSGEEVIPLGKAKVSRPGDDVTIVSHGYQVIQSLKAAEALAGAGISAEVVDIRSLKPLDMATISASASKTGRAVLVEESPLAGGVTAEVAARLGEAAFGYLEAPIIRVGAADCPIPAALGLEAAVLPSVASIVDAAKRATSGDF